ncbi:MAG TPA: glycosyltransferase [Pseudonocardiaceae bacterium]|nr:glycosyltransferase [Pseudonocardiaceae bacterium]
MRIAQLANFHSPTSGGLRTAVDTIGRGYLAAGHDRVLVVPGRDWTAERGDAGLVITLPGVPVSGGYRMVLRRADILRTLDRVRPDSVEVSDKATMTVAGDWARRHGAAAVLFSHERLDRWLAARLPGAWRLAGPTLDGAVARWNRQLAGRFDVVVVTSAYAAAEFGDTRVCRVPLGVDLDTFRPGATLFDNGPIRLAYAGRVSQEKNPGAVIEAVKLLVRNGTDVRLDVYGTGAALPAIRRAAHGLPVVCHGHVAGRAELAGRLAAADVAFAPSPAETFGLSVLEALACGTPVVAAHTGGAAELLAPDAGVAVPPTPAGIADGVAEVLSWPVAGRRAAARRQAERYPWSATVERMLTLHATVADGGVNRTVARTEDTR